MGLGYEFWAFEIVTGPMGQIKKIDFFFSEPKTQTDQQMDLRPNTIQASPK